jgi:hypothetical protein
MTSGSESAGLGRCQRFWISNKFLGDPDAFDPWNKFLYVRLYNISPVSSDPLGRDTWTSDLMYCPQMSSITFPLCVILLLQLSLWIMKENWNWVDPLSKRKLISSVLMITPSFYNLYKLLCSPTDSFLLGVSVKCIRNRTRGKKLGFSFL